MKKQSQEEDLMGKIVSLCKRRGFVFPGSEIYGGLANTYDYGPMGVELKNNIKAAWWKYFVQDRDDMTGIDGGIILSPKIWEASGHIKNFKDPLVECKKCHKRFRPDKLEKSDFQGKSDFKDLNPSLSRRSATGAKAECPDCGGEFTETKMFSGMFKTIIGPVEEEGMVAYLRPETAQAIFANYKNVLDSTNKKIPFGIGQMGKAFRNEITTGNFIFRTLEFEQMEIEYFINPDSDWNKIFESWVDYMRGFMDIIGLDRKKMKDNEISAEERAFYSKRTIDMEYKFPFGQDELWAIAYRTDYDLSRHQEASGVNLEYFDPSSASTSAKATEDKKATEGKRFIPHVIEPTFGVDRTLLAIISEAYCEEEVEKCKETQSPEETESRIVLKFKPQMAPYKVAVFPLLKNKPELVKKAREIYSELKKHFNVFWDDRGNIGKRYRCQDEIGTPYCVTVDFDSLEQDDVTVRDRDSMKQERVAVGELKDYFKEKLT